MPATPLRNTRIDPMQIPMSIQVGARGYRRRGTPVDFFGETDEPDLAGLSGSADISIV